MSHDRHPNNEATDPLERAVRRVKSKQQDNWDAWLMRRFTSPEHRCLSVRDQQQHRAFHT